MIDDQIVSKGASGEPAGRPALREYQRLSEFRCLIRCFLEFSEAAAARVGLTSRQHQALLAIKGVPGDAIPTIGYLAERLRIQHNSAVELTDRLADSGLVVRAPDSSDRRRVRLGLTASADRRLGELSSSHLRELRRLRPTLLQILEQDDAVADGGQE